MNFNITPRKLERWIKQEEDCYIAAGVAPAEKLKKGAVYQSVQPDKRSTSDVTVAFRQRSVATE